MDYRRLLWKYIGHVGSEEGVTFIDDWRRPRIDDPFTDEEWAELVALDALADYSDDGSIGGQTTPVADDPD